MLIKYLLVINAVGFLFMLLDKQKAKKGQRRIAENTLLTMAVFGGSLGTLVGMYSFRHKTRHRKFYIGVPVIMALQIILFVAIRFL